MSTFVIIDTSTSCAGIVADGKERTWLRRRWPTSWRWLTASWRPTSTESKWKVTQWKNKDQLSPRNLLLLTERDLHPSIPTTAIDSSPLSPGHEGRIGMAAVVLKEGRELDCSDVYQQVANYLPAYARPRFIRVQVRRHSATKSDPWPPLPLLFTFIGCCY